MMTPIVRDSIISALLLIFAVVLLDPFHAAMSMPSMITVSVGALILLVLLIVSLYRERARDEREGLHLMLASRIGYLFGASALVIGVITQAFSHNVDPWLVIALAGLLLGKLAAALYAQMER